MTCDLGFFLILVAGLLVVAAVGLLRGAGARRRDAGLPQGRVVYRDTEGEPGRTLFSDRYRLAGRPDYLVLEKGALCPVEVKPGRTDSQPREGDVLQLAAYCLLVEETEQRRPPHGYLRYAHRTFEVPYTDELREAVLEAMADMRRDLAKAEVLPQHEEAGRCRGCGLREECDARRA